MKNLIWLAGIGVGGYFLYEWMLTQCATSGSSLYGGPICNFLSPTVAPTATAIVTTATPNTGTAPTTAQQAAPVAIVPVSSPATPATPTPLAYRCPNNADCASPIAFSSASINSQFMGVSGLAGNRIPSGFIHRRPM
jgi:hypothetical protein